MPYAPRAIFSLSPLAGRGWGEGDIVKGFGNLKPASPYSQCHAAAAANGSPGFLPTLHSRRHFGSAKPHRPGEIAIRTGPTHRRLIRLYRRSLPPPQRAEFRAYLLNQKIPLFSRFRFSCINLEAPMSAI
jgi:hypothetical protein